MKLALHMELQMGGQRALVIFLVYLTLSTDLINASVELDEAHSHTRRGSAGHSPIGGPLNFNTWLGDLAAPGHVRGTWTSPGPGIPQPVGTLGHHGKPGELWTPSSSPPSSTKGWVGRGAPTTSLPQGFGDSSMSPRSVSGSPPRTPSPSHSAVVRRRRTLTVDVGPMFRRPSPSHVTSPLQSRRSRSGSSGSRRSTTSPSPQLTIDRRDVPLHMVRPPSRSPSPLPSSSHEGGRTSPQPHVPAHMLSRHTSSRRSPPSRRSRSSRRGTTTTPPGHSHRTTPQGRTSHRPASLAVSSRAARRLTGLIGFHPYTPHGHSWGERLRGLESHINKKGVIVRVVVMVLVYGLTIAGIVALSKRFESHDMSTAQTFGAMTFVCGTFFVISGIMSILGQLFGSILFLNVCVLVVSFALMTFAMVGAMLSFDRS